MTPVDPGTNSRPLESKLSLKSVAFLSSTTHVDPQALAKAAFFRPQVASGPRLKFKTTGLESKLWPKVPLFSAPGRLWTQAQSQDRWSSIQAVAKPAVFLSPTTPLHPGPNSRPLVLKPSFCQTCCFCSPRTPVDKGPNSNLRVLNPSFG